ncbi:MAG: hypothetical protein CL422_06780 [Acidimicrobiaceae bacterium]|nr:hypothetical protein [Acidimicrobiaceae bacterium]MCH2626013.1 hypothetical protein [Acidimicrobiales bacterium]MEC8976764.1 hypothetical protein [Actinomycetota bacterium]MED5173858.1 hypothetical protein [Actinomycetota bacterium]
MRQLGMSWNENPEDAPDEQPVEEDPGEYELHGPSDGLEIGQVDAPTNPFQRLLAFFRKS